MAGNCLSQSVCSTLKYDLIAWVRNYLGVPQYYHSDNGNSKRDAVSLEKAHTMLTRVWT